MRTANPPPIVNRKQNTESRKTPFLQRPGVWQWFDRIEFDESTLLAPSKVNFDVRLPWYSEEDVTDPIIGPDEGEEICVRGGGWNGDAEICLSASRYHLYPSVAASMVGFRVVLETSETPVLSE